MNFLFSAFILEIIKPLFHSCVCIVEDWGGGFCPSICYRSTTYCPQSLELLISLGVSFLFIQVRGQGNVRINGFDCRVCRALFTWMG